MTQTREDRIFRHYTRLRRHSTVCCVKHWRTVGEEIWMPLARTWRMPIRELKAIVAKEKERRRS